MNSDVSSGLPSKRLKEEHGLGHGHAMALTKVIQSGPEVVDPKFVGATGPHRDESLVLWLDGIATKPVTA